MSTIELIVSVLAILFVIVLLSSVGYCIYTESKFSNKPPEPRNYPPCPSYTTTTPVFDGKEWVRKYVSGTPEQIEEQKKVWDNFSNIKLSEYEKSARIRNVIALRKKLKERHCEQYCK